MRAALRRALFSTFDSSIRRALPAFERISHERGRPNCAIWAAVHSLSLTFFVFVSAADDHDEFAVEIAWSDDGQFPWKNRSFKFQDTTSAKARGRISYLWVKDGLDQSWNIVPRETLDDVRAKQAAQKCGDLEMVRRIQGKFEIPVEQAIKLIEPLVNDAMDKIIRYGMPLFKIVADQKGERDGIIADIPPENPQ